MSQSKAVRDFGDLRAKQAAFLAAKAKAALQGPTSPVSSSGGRPGSSNLTPQSSSSPESPVQRQADSTATPSTLEAAQEVPNGKTARARLFKSGHSSPVAPASPQPAGTTSDKQQPSQQQSSSQQLSEQLPEKLLRQQQQQQQQQQSHSMPQLQQHPQALSAAAQPQEHSETQPAQAQQSESMQQLLKPSGPSTLRNSILEQLTQGAPTSSGWPAEVKQYFKKLLDHSVELSLEKRGLNDKLGRAEAQAQEIQEHLEYQAEQMMDLQSQVNIHAHHVCPVCPCPPAMISWTCYSPGTSSSTADRAQDTMLVNSFHILYTCHEQQMSCSHQPCARSSCAYIV